MLTDGERWLYVIVQIVVFSSKGIRGRQIIVEGG